MADCDNCGDEVIHVWRHRSRTGTMTHSETTWVCADCHPELPDVLKHERDESETGETTTTDGGETERTVVTDGGKMTCPACAGETVDGQGLYDCLECDWHGAR